MNTFVFQIFFDDESRQALDPGFIPFDNQCPIERELYEFSVMYHWFKSHELEDSAYYGFVSPSFYIKTGIRSQQLYGFINGNYGRYDAFYLSSGWDQIAFHQNVFFQGEYYHPGFLEVAKDFIQCLGGDPTKVGQFYSTFTNSIFSNYVVANKTYWQKWLVVADHFYQTYQSKALHPMHARAIYAKADTTHAVFLQERLHSILLMDESSLRVLPFDTTIDGPILASMFSDSPLNRKLLRSCEALKSLYNSDSDPEAIDLYRRLQAKVKLAS